MVAQCNLDINIFLLGQPRVIVEETSIFKDLNTKAMVLVYYLGANKGKSFSREVLSELLWPDIPMENSKSNLRQILSQIKKACTNDLGVEESIISTGKGECCLSDEFNICVDLPNFYKGIKEGLSRDEIAILEKSLELYKGGFLEGFYAKGSASIDEWILFERESVSRVFREGSKRLTTLYENSGKLQEATNCLERLLKTDTLQEDIHRELMRVYYKLGDRNKAINQYNQCTKFLRKELNISPMEETKLLYGQIVAESSLESNKTSNSQTVEQEFLQKENLFFVKGSQCFNETVNVLKARISEEIAIKVNPFGNQEYEGIYSLLEGLFSKYLDIDNSYCETKRFPEEQFLYSNFLSGEWVSENDLSFAKTLNCIKRVIERKGKEVKGLLIIVEDYAGLDEKTKKLVRYLLGNIKGQGVYMVVRDDAESFNNF